MKTAQTLRNTLTTCAALATLTIFTSCSGDGQNSHEGHDHDHGEHDHHEGHAHDDRESQPSEKKDAGPNGGRIITEVEPHLEFFLLPDHKVQITALTEDSKSTAIGDQIITVTVGDRSAPADLKFSRKGDVLISDTAFPTGDKLPVIMQIQSGTDAEPVFARFALDLSDCPGCPYKEYACVCDHAH